MNPYRQHPAHALWRSWKRVSFSSQMLWQKKKHGALSAPEYDASQEENLVILSAEKAPEAIPKTIWMVWLDDQLPPSLRLNINQLRQDNPDHTLHLVTQRTLAQWLPEMTFISADLTPAHKSEIIRLELLHRFGGIGIDGGTLLFEKLDWVHQVQQDKPMDVIGYYRENSTLNFLSPVIEGWFIAAAPGNAFIREWLKQLAPIKNLGVQNYINDLKKRDDYPLIVQKIHHPAQAVLSLAQQVAVKEYRRVNFHLRKADANAWFYQQLHAGNSDAFACSVLFRQRPQTPPPVICLSGDERLHLDFNLRIGLYNRASLLGEMMQAPARPTLALPSGVDKARA
ncbi:glycosyltransferase family 32 protein [Pantoea sp. RRHST58]|uniref:glycosyltransferase family 32 protein n=1 Tax=Pantoea sp. RRHST58 TaxID=3425183 RepID=UPI003DA15E75